MESEILGCGIYRFGLEAGILDVEKVHFLRGFGPDAIAVFGCIGQFVLGFCHNTSFQFSLD